MIFRVLDIETVPDYDVWGPGPQQYRITAGDEARRSPHTERLARLAGSALYQPLVAEVEPFPPPQACRVVAIASLDVRFAPDHVPVYWYDGCRTACRWAGTTTEADVLERSLLQEFSDLMADDSVHLVTWNGRGFDLPVIMMRSLRHRVAQPWYYKRRDMRYRFSPEGHCDLMDFLGDYGSARYMKLDEVARACGLPGKTDVHGDEVGALYNQAMLSPADSAEIAAKVARYCLGDVVQTALVWVLSRLLLGKVVPATLEAVLQTFRASPEVNAAVSVPWDRLLPAAGAEVGA